MGENRLQEEQQKVAGLSIEEATERVETITNGAHAPSIGERRDDLLYELIALHERLRDEVPDEAMRAQQAFVLVLRGQPSILENDDFRHFIVQTIRPTDFEALEWKSANEVIEVAEVLYAMRFDSELSPQKVESLVAALVRDALRSFESEGTMRRDDMFELVLRSPIPAAHMNAELRRLRSRVYLYEQRRVDRLKKVLYNSLLFQALLVFFLFPLLFQNFENGSIQREIEGSTQFAISEGRVVCTDQVQDLDCRPPYQFLSFGDSLYWSTITFASVGYGDITPVTPQGKTMAAIHGLMGVLSTGIIAGLVLNWITPRDID